MKINLKTNIEFALLLFVAAVSCVARSQCVDDQNKKFQGYAIAAIQSELQNVIPQMVKGVHDKSIASTRFSLTKYIFELTEFPGIIFKAKALDAPMPSKSLAIEQKQSDFLKSIIVENKLDLLCIPNKAFFTIIDGQGENWHVCVEEKGRLAESTHSGQQKLLESYVQKAYNDKSIALFLTSLFKQLTTFMCLSGIVDITPLNFPFLENRRQIMIIDTDLPETKNIIEGLTRLLLYAHPDYFEVILSQAALTLHQTTESVMCRIIGEQLNENENKSERMEKFKRFIKRKKLFQALEFGGIGLWETVSGLFSSQQNQQLLWV